MFPGFFGVSLLEFHAWGSIHSNHRPWSGARGRNIRRRMTIGRRWDQARDNFSMISATAAGVADGLGDGLPDEAIEIIAG